MMKWIIENWFVILALIVLAVAVVCAVVYFFKLPTEQQKANVKEWLKYAVTMAEKDLGSGTGQLKLRKVYDSAIAKFPWIALAVSFETFSQWVDEALEWMKNQLKENKSIETLVTNSITDKTEV